MAEIILAKNPPVATVTLNRPDDLNRLTPDSMALLGRIVDDIGADAAIHAVVVTGAGDRAFSAGLLNPEIRAAMAKPDVLAFVFLANRVFDALSDELRDALEWSDDVDEGLAAHREGRAAVFKGS